MLSPQILNAGKIKTQQAEARLFNTEGTPWTDGASFKRYYLSFPFFPFRTLCPREMTTFQINKHLAKPDFDNASCLLPAHTQMSVTFTRRNIDNYLNFMLPFNVTALAGGRASTLTAEERTAATTFQKTVAAAQVNTSITSVRIDINAAYLQVPPLP